MYQKVQDMLMFPFISLNVDSSFNIGNKLLKFHVPILHIVMQEILSWNCYLGLSFCFM